MNHIDCLNMLLSNACPTSEDKETKVATFILELHCVTYKVVAKYLGDFKYEIISCEQYRINCINYIG